MPGSQRSLRLKSLISVDQAFVTCERVPAFWPHLAAREPRREVNAPPPKGGGFGVTDSSPDSEQSSAEVFRPKVGSKPSERSSAQASGLRPARRLPSEARLKPSGPRPAEATHRHPPLGSRRYALG